MIKIGVILGIICFPASLLFGQSAPIQVPDRVLINELFFDGLREKLAENYENAANHFIKITQTDSLNDAAYYELAYAYLKQRKFIPAESAVKKAIALKKENPWYYKLQAELYKLNGNIKGLIPVFDHLILLQPGDENHYFDRANACFLSGDLEEAEKAYTLLESLFGNSRDLTVARQRLRTTGKVASADLESIHQMIREQPEEVRNYLYLSGQLVTQNKKEEAIEWLKKAKEVAPDHFEVDLALAEIYHMQKKNELAIIPLRSAFAHPEMPVPEKVKIVAQLLPRFGNAVVVRDATELSLIALKTHPEDPALLILYGDVLYQQGNLSGARQQYELSLKKSTVYQAWEKLLAVQTLTGAYTEAILTGQEALTYYPNHAILYYYLAFALHRNGQSAAAGEEIKAALSLDSSDPQLKALTYALQAEILIDQQKMKEADAAFDKSIALAPDNYLTLSNYAYYLALRNQHLSKAETLAAKAAAALPHNASIADTYAYVLWKQQKYLQAKKWIETALKYEPKQAVYLERYGDILFHAGEKEEAVKQWEQSRNEGNASEKLMRKINEKKYIK